MNTLRAKITALLVASVLLVVLAATGLSVLLLAPPRMDQVDDAIAAQWGLVAEMVARGALPDTLQNEFVGIHDSEPAGDIIENATHGINAALAHNGRSERIVVKDGAGLPWPVVAGRLADGRWLAIPLGMPPPGPKNGGWALAGWALFIAIGTTLVIVVAVRRLTEPLALLERTVATLGPDGELEPLPEAGPTEVRAAARAINLLSTRLKRAMESRIRMVAAAGHDLRTPMTRMRLRAEFLDEEERANWIADLDELDRIADSAIRVVREEVERSSRTCLRLDELVSEVVAELVAIGLAISLASTAPASVVARPLALRRAIRNLAINAATHGHKAIIRVEAEHGRAAVVIEDEGPGIPEELMLRVFEPFFRIDTVKDAPVPGAGLGLAIAREIITGNDGTLELRNGPRGGLVQRIGLPTVITS
ncbi:signal transduction histidine kinase [Angulomicrobium tetraedrale]|uniref:histidine kinase n=1 Tax=Ancylobacter tetraedralis TaxID=217068 RepID=A0A839Z629_9HYPH|nr:ATP-binding protein [Ancylobacter tetraedralis]MBB3770431.1 signal transduction histidine kinase [Ancylobacter tetraedralis]